MPADVAAGLRKLMRTLGLTYGACDFAVTPTGEHLLFEVNSAGAFGWLEEVMGLPISEAIADVLLGHEEGRS